MIFYLGEAPGGQASGLIWQRLDSLGLKVLIEGRPLYPEVPFLRDLTLIAGNEIDGLKLAVADEPVDDALR